MPKIYNKRIGGYPPEAKYIGRGSPYGNNWSHMENSKAEFKVETREQSIEMYELWLQSQPDLVKKIKRELKGQDLLCFCSPLPCHGEILLKIANDKSPYYRNWFSNMLPFESPLIYDRMEFKSVENFYQAMKIPREDRETREFIAALSPFESKKKIREFVIREDWRAICLDVMEYALRHKFARGTEWRRKLDLTTWELVEYNNWQDRFWGVCLSDKRGENHLGKLLMKIRDESP